ncbi:MAG: hypothetical protein CMP07_02700 [Xanthomonadales bacterium]|nr:hypothetical protein [Xanthomonadales bacterium]|tara:strand:- start:1829 stop:2446 length:618 start_codon:yes stop_codon:yes gene_type:complete
MPVRSVIEILAESSEVVIDQGLRDGLLKDIPVVGFVAKSIDVVSSIRDKLFASKIVRFLEAIEEIGEEEKSKLREKMSNSPQEAGKVGEVVILTIEQATDSDKSDLVANVFLAYVSGIITANELRRMCDVVDKSFVDDLLDFTAIHNMGKKTEHPALTRLRNTPLVDMFGGDKIDDIGKQYARASKFGKKFVNAHLHGKALRQRQ